MKPLLLLILLLTFTSSLHAQKSNTNQPIPLTTDTVYFDQDWEKTELKEDIKYARIIKRTGEGTPYGTVRNFYYPSWKKQWEGKLLSEDPDVLTGLCTTWYFNGKVQSIATYNEGEAQEDMRMWNENGTKVICKYKYIDALPLTKAKLHSYYNTGSSRIIQAIDLPTNTSGIVFKIDIRDEGKPPIDWSTAARFASISMTGGASELLLAGARAMSKSSYDAPASTINTKCHYYITTSLEDAEYFKQTKGRIPKENSCIWQTNNISQETKHLIISKDVSKLYFLIMNDNDLTSAQATLSVSVLQKQCK